MSDIWFTSDTHFGHANFLNFVDDDGIKIRPFDSVTQMDEYMIEKWNSVVKPGDKVYHLGDVCWNTEDFKTINTKLNGSKQLIVGNHDDIVGLSKGGFFKKVYFWRLFKEFNFTCSHVPLRRDQMRHYIWLNVHGHTHNNFVNEEPGYLNICVENWDYTPLNIDFIREFASRTYTEHGELNDDGVK